MSVWANKQAHENDEESEPSDPEDETKGREQYEAGRGNDSDIELSSEDSEAGSGSSWRHFIFRIC